LAAFLNAVAAKVKVSLCAYEVNHKFLLSHLRCLQNPLGKSKITSFFVDTAASK